jgi:hypothetical protein
MGRLVKHTQFQSGSYTVGIPASAAAYRPGNAVVGQTRFSTSIDKLEYFTATGTWQTVSNVGTGTSCITKSAFTGNTGRTEFGPMAITEYATWEANALVHVGGVYQIPTTNYTFYGNTTIHFVSAPSNGSDITIIHGLNSTIAS